MPHGTVGSVTLPRPVGRVPVLTNDANPAVGCRTDPWEPTPRNVRDAGFSASHTPAQVPRADVTLGNVYETACAKRWGFSQPSTAVGQSHVGFTPAVNGGILSSKKKVFGAYESGGEGRPDWGGPSASASPSRRRVRPRAGVRRAGRRPRRRRGYRPRRRPSRRRRYRSRRPRGHRHRPWSRRARS